MFGCGKETKGNKEENITFPCLVFKENRKENKCFTFVPLTMGHVTKAMAH